MNAVRSSGRAHACPRCGSDGVARSRSGGLIRVLRVLSVHRYRCLDCWHAFLGFSLGSRRERAEVSSSRDPAQE